MRIHNVRLGHATNSSSYHSFILLGDGVEVQDSLLMPPFGYGWERFVIASPEEKRRYMATQLWCQTRHEVGDANARALVLGVTGVNVGLDPEDEPYVDHQSVLRFPVERGNNGVDLEFFREMLDAVLSDKIAIFGGNDNETDGKTWHSDYGERVFTEVETESRGRCYARKDPKHGTWTLFSPFSGHKVRFSFDDSSDPGRVWAPELVDIKITDYCEENCAFCYQGSSREGAHASESYVRSVVYALEKLGVFEMAIGGGDPTKHPRFIEILWSIEYVGIVANFSTRNLGWLHDKKMAEQVLPRIGAFAYSARTSGEVNDFAEVVKRCGFPASKAHLQVIPQVIDRHELRSILTAAKQHRHPVTLLGFKQTGRGAEYVKAQRSREDWRFRDSPESRWVGVVADMHKDRELHRVGIDTVLAVRYRSDLEAMGVPDYMYYTTEGTFSMYVDAVNKQAGPSSFCEPEQMVDLPDPSAETIVAAFEGWQ